MSELREECYKCLNNQSCPGAADYGSIICMTKRKYKMLGNEEDSIYAHKFAIMQKQIDEKEKKIKELEEALLKVKDKNTTLFITCRNSIPVQKVKDKIEEYKDTAKRIAGTYQYADSGDDLLEKKKKVIELRTKAEALEELLEDK